MLQYETVNVARQSYITGRRAGEIAASVEAAIGAGTLGGGSRLPTVRDLAADLGVSPATVAAAYRELRVRGLVCGEGRRGTTVTQRPPLLGRPRPLLRPGLRDLASGNPDPALLPDWSGLLQRLPDRSTSYGAETVDPELAALARERLRADGVEAERLTLVSGALDALERVLAAHLRPGDPVAVEDPAYPGILDVCRAMALRLLPVAVDERGMRPDALEPALAAGARAVLVTPRSQNPFGAALDEGRAAELRALLERRPDALVVEDDHAESVGGGEPVTLTSGRRSWAIVRSVSKTLGPDLRLGVLAGDEVTVGRVEGRMALGPGWVSHLLQRLVVELWGDPRLPATLERAARTYAARRTALVDALAERGVAAHARTGFNVWVPLADEGGAVAALAEAGFAVTPGERFRLASGPALRVTVASLDAGDAPAVASAIADSVRGRPGRLG